MRAFRFLGERFADVMKKSGALCSGAVRAQFIGYDAGKKRDFNGMAEHVLPVTGAVFEPAEQFDDFGVQPVHTGFKRCLFSGLFDGGVHFFARFFHHFFDSRRVNASV